MKEEIKQIFKGEVEDDKETLSKYSHDASLFTVRPKLVVFPKDSEDVRNLVKWVNENKAKYPDLSITARSAGTDMTGGPLNESIIMDFTRHMNKLLKFDSDSKIISVQPGMYYRDFEKIVSEKGLMMPAYPASKSICAMGGMFANNAGGEKTLKYGKTEDYIASTKIVFSDGKEYEIKAVPKGKISENKFFKQIYELITSNDKLITDAKPKVSKNSAGYYIWNVLNQEPLPNPLLDKERVPKVGEVNFDLNKLLVGSQGTLGIVTEITFKLVPIPKNQKLVIVFLNKIEQIGKLVNEILKYNPESLEAYDDKTLKIAIKFSPSFLKGKGVWGSIKFAWSFWPDIFMLMRQGFPKLVVLAEFSGSEEEISRKYSELKKYLDFSKIPSRISKSKADTDKYWEIRHESFNLLRSHVKGKKTVPFVDDVIVRPEFLPEFLPKLEEILSKYPELEHTIAGHPGDGNFHIIPLVDINDPRLKKDVLEVSDKVYDLVKKYGGSITAEHNDGIIRTPYLNKMFSPEILKIFRNIKQIFDPQNIFNPGKKVPASQGSDVAMSGTLEDIAKYL